MEPGAIFVGLAMAAASVPFLVKPFQKKRDRSARQAVTPPGPDEKRKADLSALLDLDFDFRTGKVSEEDYTMLRAGLVADAARHIQEKSMEDERLEEVIRARRASQARVRICSHCGKKVEADSRFCPRCGTPAGTSCPSCGTALQEGDLFCTACGKKLANGVEPVA